MDKTATETLDKAAKALGLSGTETEAQFLPTLEKVLLEKNTLAEQVNKTRADAGLASQVAELTQKIGTFEAEKQRLEGQLTQKTEAIDNLKAQIEELTQQRNSTSQQNEKLVDLQGEKAELEVKVQALEKTKTALENTIQELRANRTSAVTRMLSTAEAEKMADKLVLKANNSVPAAFTQFFTQPNMAYHEIPVATALYNKLLQDPSIQTPQMLAALFQRTARLGLFGNEENGFRHGVGFQITNPLTGNKEQYMYPSVLWFKELETHGYETDVFSLADNKFFNKTVFNSFMEVEEAASFHLEIPLRHYKVIMPKKETLNDFQLNGSSFSTTKKAILTVTDSLDSYKKQYAS